MQETTLLSSSEQRVLQAFRQFLVTPGQMLCFYGRDLEKYQTGLQQLAQKDLVVKEEFKGGFSLTRKGYAAMRQCG